MSRTTSSPASSASSLSPISAVSVIAAVVALVIATVALQRDAGQSTSFAAVAEAGDAVAAAPVTPVDVVLNEFAIAPDPITVVPGTVLSVTNEGAIPHNLKVRGQEDAYATADLDSSGNAVLDTTGLEPGVHPLYCDIAGHDSSGMVAELVIDEEAAEAVDEGGAAGDGSADAPLTGMAQAEFLRANYEASVSRFPAATEAMGNQRMDPEVLADGTKVFELVLSYFDWEVAPGEVVRATGYNGQVPGPWIHTEVGDTVTLRVVNDLDDEATTLHPHGIFRHDFEVDGVGMVSMDPIMPGETWEETFVTDEISVGMYHGHDNGVHQVPNGAFGVFTVGQLPLPPQVDDVVAEESMVLNDAGTIGLTLNGKSFPATEPYVLEQGEQMLLHFYNEGLSPHPMHLHNQPMMIIAKDGYPLAQPIVMDTVNVAPGERYSAVVFAETVGSWVFHCHILTHVERSDGSVFGMFTVLIVEPSSDPDADEQAIADDIARRVGRGLLGGPASVEALSGSVEAPAGPAEPSAGSAEPPAEPGA
jgi:manganese oxidase